MLTVVFRALVGFWDAAVVGLVVVVGAWAWCAVSGADPNVIQSALGSTTGGSIILLGWAAFMLSVNLLVLLKPDRGIAAKVGAIASSRWGLDMPLRLLFAAMALAPRDGGSIVQNFIVAPWLDLLI